MVGRQSVARRAWHGASHLQGTRGPDAMWLRSATLAFMLESMMNRQIRREQAKLDKKTEKDKLKRRSARKAKYQALRHRREIRGASKSSKSGKAANGVQTRVKRDPNVPLTPEQRKKLPGRFSGVLMMATVLFIVLQAAVPTEGVSRLNSITGAGFFLLFAYFSLLYLERRAAARPLFMTLVSGGLLVAGVTVARLLQPELGVDWLMTAIAVPGVVAGAFLGRLVFFNTPV